MHILIIAATPFEIEETLSFIEAGNQHFNNNSIDAAIAGIGGVATAYNLTAAIYKKKPDMILQAGIAGSFISNKITEVVAVEKEIFGDTGVWENNVFKTIFDLKLTGENENPFTEKMLINPYKKLLASTSLEQVAAITVNEISTRQEQINFYKQNFSPVVESMEGAAFHYVCLKEKIPFLQVRAISNDIGERDKTNWKMKEAITALNEKCILIIKEICRHNETYFRI